MPVNIRPYVRKQTALASGTGGALEPGIIFWSRCRAASKQALPSPCSAHGMGSRSGNAFLSSLWGLHFVMAFDILFNRSLHSLRASANDRQIRRPPGAEGVGGDTVIGLVSIRGCP